MRIAFFTTLASLTLATCLQAGETINYSVKEDIDDILFAVENEIIGRGLKIDHVSHVGDMLVRTQMDVGATKTIYRKAEVITFCSATLSREMMEINPANLTFCPYKIFVYSTIDQPDITHIGLDTFPDGEMKKVEAFLDQIVKDAIGQD